MRFEFYSEAIANTPKLSVDGTVANSVHFSHWNGNETPPEVKADTSTEIALNLVASPNKPTLTRGIELVTNNHFDTDGVLSVWTVLNGERALKFRDLLIAAAEAGDFSEFSSKDGICVSLAIQGNDQAFPNEDTASPLARSVAKEAVTDDARSYDLVLPQVESLLTNPAAFESLWLEGWSRISAAMKSFESAKSRVQELGGTGVTLITLAQELFGENGFNPTRHLVPFTAISKFANGELFVVAVPSNNGWCYRIDYPYYSWAETVVRPRVARRDLSGVVESLNRRERNSGGRWQTDDRELTSAVKFVDENGRLVVSGLMPEEVVSDF
ncbi:MAG TPA: DUF6687 family protein [Pyrinomonadaceae bacterium]|nr:DUF6687 family protein [Pyrinomonadaceae bacterium]